MEKTAVGRHTPSNPKLLAYVSPHALYVYFSCFSLSPALIQSSFFNVISVKLLPFGKIRSLAGASGCCKHRTLPQPQQKPSLSLISKVSLKITSGGKVFKRHRKTWLLDEIKSGVDFCCYVIASYLPLVDAQSSFEQAAYWLDTRTCPNLRLWRLWFWAPIPLNHHDEPPNQKEESLTGKFLAMISKVVRWLAWNLVSDV